MPVHLQLVTTCQEQSLVFADVWRERSRQDLKWGVQDHKGPVGLTILGEEFGEACKAVLEHDRSGYYEELKQVAAVAIAAMEAERRRLFAGREAA